MATRIFAKAGNRIKKQFDIAIDALAEYDLTDVMIALSFQRGGTTPLYEAVEEACEEIDDREI